MTGKYRAHDRERVGFCAALLAIAVLLRVATAAQTQDRLREAAESSAVIAALLQLESGGTVQTGEPQTEDYTFAALEFVEQTADEAESDEPDAETALEWTQEDAARVVIAGTSTYAVDAAELLAQPLDLSITSEAPQVLIIHTHASEAYTPEAGWEYEATDTLRTSDTDYNVVRVGQAIADALTARGIGVIHDTTIRDYPSYNGSYTRTLAAIEEYLAEYPTIGIVLDVHRDAAENADGTPVAVRCTVDGESAAQLMLVVGTDEGGLSHPNWRKNLALAARLQALLTRETEDLCRPIDLRTERFNQHATTGSLLVEVGASGNTLQEALRAAEQFAEALAEIVEDST